MVQQSKCSIFSLPNPPHQQENPAASMLHRTVGRYSRSAVPVQRQNKVSNDLDVNVLRTNNSNGTAKPKDISKDLYRLALDNNLKSFSGDHKKISTIKLAAEKPIVRSPRPRDFNSELLALTKNHVSKHHHGNSTFSAAPDNGRRWCSTTTTAMLEYALSTPRRPVPQTTLEECADQVKHRVQKTHPEPCEWQRYASEWDVMQLRPRYGPATKIGNLPEIRTKSGLIASENVSSSQDEPSSANGNSTVSKEKRQTSKEGHKCVQFSENTEMPKFTQPMPGYGGFVPRYPLVHKPISDRDCINASMCSTSRRTYRSYPPQEYTQLVFAHRGILSKTVTLTYPFNAFNKVE